MGLCEVGQVNLQMPHFYASGWSGGSREVGQVNCHLADAPTAPSGITGITHIQKSVSRGTIPFILGDHVGPG